MHNNKDMKIHVENVTRVEGHGIIDIEIKNGEVTKCLWKIPETARYFEAMVRGRRYDEIAGITSRVCGICSIGHHTASQKATENAFGITISPQTEKFRKLLMHAENFQSHILHTLYLVLPDLLGMKSVVEVAMACSNETKIVTRLHGLGNEMSALIGGRTTHPITSILGGFTKLPSEKELEDMRKKLLASLNDYFAVVELLEKLATKIPIFTRETEYISLKDNTDYAILNGNLYSSDNGFYSNTVYRNVMNEFCVPHSTAKFTKNTRDSFMVGALARFNNNHDTLRPLALKVAEKLELKAPCHNPFMNSVAQVIEIAHSIEDSIFLIQEILDEGIQKEHLKDIYNRADSAIKAGEGIGIVEVPRGLLIHNYKYDEKGLVIEANCVIPTNMNHWNIQYDLEKLIPELLKQGKTKEEIQLTCEMNVRAYDPCISCSVHEMRLVNMDWK
ncbi:MAG: Ni/Fe hydrogenase subunit alpha [Patescibacteria group bacterium]